MPQPAETHRMGEFLSRIGTEIDDVRSLPPEDALRRRGEWASLDERLPRHGVGADVTIDELSSLVMPHGNHIASAGFWGWIMSAGSTTPAIAAAAANSLAMQKYGITAFNFLEELSLDWLAELCGLSPTMKGVYSSGGSTANLVGLGAARQEALTRVGVDPAHDGVGGRKLAVYASEESHHTVARSAAVLGIGRSNVRMIETDARQRMSADHLAKAVREDVAVGVLPVAIVATTGTTNTGAIDPVADIASIAKEYEVWLHIDGAYGLPGILDERVSDRYSGLEFADSAIVDPHKWLGAPIGVGATFVRDRQILFDAFTQEPADYLEGAFSDDDAETMFEDMGIPYSEFGVELSSPSRGVQVWALIKELGLEGVRHRIVTDNDYARYVTSFAEDHPKLEPLTEPDLSIACFRWTDSSIEDLDAFNKELLLGVRRSSRFVISSTVVDGDYVLRPCFVNPRTSQEDVDEFLDVLIATGSKMSTT